MSNLRSQPWRIAMILGGITLALGGSQHPDGDPEASTRHELAEMTAADSWVLSHALISVGTALLAVGLWGAWRSRTWPARTGRAVHAAAIVMSIYVVETLFHLAAAVDTDELAHGDAAPVAFTHLGLSVLLYPLSGFTFAWMNVRLFPVLSPPTRVLAVLGVVAGVAHGSSVLLTFVLPDAELSPVFASAGMTFAAWSIGSGLTGLRLAADRSRRRPAMAAVPTPVS